jgi:hypothetical protein
VIRKNAVGKLIAITAAALALAGLGAGLAEAAAPAWRVLAATTPTDLPPVTDAVQQVKVDGSAGTFALGFEGQTTGALPYDAAPATIQSALDALSTIGGVTSEGVSGSVTVTGGPGNAGAENPYLVSFDGALAGLNVPALTADASALQGGAGTATVTTTVEGKRVFEGGSLDVTATDVGGAATSAVPTLTLSIGPLPAGISTRAINETDISTHGVWNCPAAAEGTTLTCTYSVAVPALTTSPTIHIPLTVDGALAPERSTLPVTLSGGEAGTDTEDVPLVVSPVPAGPGVAAFWAGAFDADGRPVVQAGAHPYSASSGFWLNSVLAPNGVTIVPVGRFLRTARVGLPPGFVGDPMATQQRCPQYAPAVSTEEKSSLCSLLAAGVGRLFVGKGAWNVIGLGGAKSETSQIFNDVPAFGTAAEFAANVNQLGNVSLTGSVRSGTDFGVDVTGLNLPAFQEVWASITALEGFPASTLGKAFLRNPTDCSLQQQEAAAGKGPFATMGTNSWANPDPGAIEDEASAAQPVVTGCAALTAAWRGEGSEPEKPSFEFRPATNQASAPTGATARLHIPQAGLTDPNKLGTSDLKKTVVTLPQGLGLNPSAGQGLQSCTEAQVGYETPGKPGGEPLPANATRFDEAPVTCPEGSKLGTVQVRSPLLEEELEGTIYLAAQEENPFHSLIALYLVVESERFGLTLKLPGEVKPDPTTGQLTATFDDNPQLPFEELTLHLRGGGPRSLMATPEVCGHYATTGALTPWSAESTSPSEAAAVEEPGFNIGASCAGSAGSRPFAPSFEAGTTATQAGAYSPLVIKIARKDGEQELNRLEFTLPKGLTGKLAGIPYCPDASIAAAEGRSGKAEQASASCPAASELGTVDTAAGYGSEPIHVGGHVYLAGPYEGAPLSAVVITPAVAGPFDLGNVVVRAPLFVNPETAQITTRSDPIPTILKGIPLKLRSVTIDVNRSGFTLNPTSCEPMSVTASLGSSNGATATPSSRFQVGNCKALAFRPKLALSLKGATKHAGHPALKAVLTYPQGPGYANIARAQVNLPHSEFIDQGNLNKTCTKPVLLAGNCPASSIYGKAKAWTPLLEKPLEGNVYLVGGYGYKLPALVAELNGQIRVVLAGKVDSGPNKGIRNTFEAVPDAPVEKFVLEMKGGPKYSLLENSENLCKKPQRAIARFTAQNGMVDQTKPLIANQCHKAKKQKKSKGHGQEGK